MYFWIEKLHTKLQSNYTSYKFSYDLDNKIYYETY